MTKTKSPLRYPGGKSILSNFFSAFLSKNNIKEGIFIEPYCGGAGSAINLLLGSKVDQIWLNDASFPIYAFWYSLKYFGDDFLELLNQKEISLQEWKKQREIFNESSNLASSDKSILLTGFATFYMNRCNRSGILSAGPIGGQSNEKQLSANYKIHARFNKKGLIPKLISIINEKDRIQVFNQDAINFLTCNFAEQPESIKSKSLIYLDPPYYNQGSTLYLNYYVHEDHKNISELLNENRTWNWILSYDNVSEIRNLYSEFDQYSFYLNYSAHESKLGKELLVHSNNTILPKSKIIRCYKSSGKTIELTPTLQTHH